MIQNPAIQGGGQEPEMVTVTITNGASSVFCIIPANGDKPISPVSQGATIVPKNSTCVAFIDTNSFIQFPGANSGNQTTLRGAVGSTSIFVIKILGDLTIDIGEY